MARIMDGILFNIEDRDIVNGVFDVPDNVVEIDTSAFEGRKQLERVVFGENSELKIIGARAFCYCTNLKSINLPGQVISIGRFAFHSCENLTDVTMGDCVELIDKHAFSFCVSLEKINIPDSVKTIEEKAFYRNHQLCRFEPLSIPSSTKVKNDAFLGSPAWIKKNKAPLSSQIQAATSRVSNLHYSNKTPVKEFSAER